jgi:hypothetical protein
MFRSMVDVNRERWWKEGWEKGRHDGAVLALRNVLTMLLREKFGSVSKAVARTIAATDDEERLHAWLIRFVRADTIEDIGIKPER